MFLESELDFDKYIKNIFDKTSKSIDLIRKLRIFLPRHLFYKSINLWLDFPRL